MHDVKIGKNYPESCSREALNNDWRRPTRPDRRTSPLGKKKAGVSCNLFVIVADFNKILMRYFFLSIKLTNRLTEEANNLFSNLACLNGTQNTTPFWIFRKLRTEMMIDNWYIPRIYPPLNKIFKPSSRVSAMPPHPLFIFEGL